MKSNLVIIGNGFDLYHHMKTRYVDYREYLMNTDNKDIIGIFERDLENDTGYDQVSFLWGRLEELICILPYEQAYSLLLNHEDDHWSDSYHHAFQDEVKRMAEYWPGLKDNLSSWIRTIEYTIPYENLRRIINLKANFISFNYTNTLEKLYGIDKDDICYIHGDASQGDNLILGHRNDTYYPEWDDNNPDVDVRLRNAGAFMDQFRRETYKPIEEIISSNTKFREFIENYRYGDIYMIGLSYNDTDKPYITEICEKQKSRWHFFYYSKDDYKAIPEYARDVGVSDYSILSYDEV